MDNLIKIEGVKKTIFGNGSVSQLGQECKALGSSRVLLVIDKTLAKGDISSKIKEILRKNRIKIF